MKHALACVLLAMLSGATLDDVQLASLKESVWQERAEPGTGLFVETWCHADRHSPLKELNACLDRLEGQGKLGVIVFYDADAPESADTKWGAR